MGAIRVDLKVTFIHIITETFDHLFGGIRIHLCLSLVKNNKI